MVKKPRTKIGTNAFIKDIFREIYKTKSRFFSIFLIVAIGVGFFAGLTASGPDMKLTADTYFDQQRLSDFRLLSTMAFTDKDIKALREMEGIRGVLPGHWVDTVLETGKDSEVVKVMGYDFDRLKNEDPDRMNMPVLLEGRFPQAPNECVVEVTEEVLGIPFQVGDSITLTSGKSDKDLTDTLSADRFTIVGIVQNPLYISVGRGTSAIGSGKVNAFIMVPNETFLEDYYTEIYLLADGVEGLSSYSEEYRRRIDTLASQLEQLGRDRAAIRLEQIRSEAAKKIAAAQQELDKGAQAQQQENARQELEKAKRDLEKLEPPEWYVLDRTDYSGHLDFGNDADRIAAIARVFPLFFLLVAALVCLTTMTRMVEEQRVQVGALKALGYRSGAIAAKFLIYALVATVTGSLAGLLVGMRLFPMIIYSAYGILYTMIPVRAPFRLDIAVSSTLAAAVTVFATVLLSCWRELAEQPASLMRPKAPKAGKRVLLERVGFIWNRFSFSYKVTFRNLFRYKKRMLMTVVGIAGCSALMLTGFGLYDAIQDIVSIQFGQLYHYDLTTVLQKDLSDSQREEAESLLFSHPQVKDSLYVRQESFQLKAPSGKSYDIYLFVPENPQRLRDFVTLRTRKGHTPVSLEQEQVVLTEKAARFLGVEAGEQVTITDADHQSYTVTVGAVAEQYTGHYLYMTPQAYEKYFHQPAVYNMVQSILEASGAGEQDAISQSLTAAGGVLAVSDTTDLKSQFADMIHSMTYVMLVLIVSAGALAFVVLYNLSNINATERMREIATIKVLGFYDREVSAYLYRENVFLTLLGTLTGLVLGIFLHHYVVVTAETDIVMFGRTIKWTSFLFSGILTLFFSLLVNCVMHFKLKKISMVESLKSVE